MAAVIKFPKPDFFYGNPKHYQPWRASIELYFRSAGITTDPDRVNYTLGLLKGSADNWKQDFITSTPATRNNYTWAHLTNAMDQSFAPTQQAYKAERNLQNCKQKGKYIENYISEFSTLMSQSGLQDSTTIRAYFSKGLNPKVRYEALRQDPQTLAEWKTAARLAWRIAEEQS
jgi:hypothetical protein